MHGLIVDIGGDRFDTVVLRVYGWIPIELLLIADEVLKMLGGAM
jgi:hypothetical protein